jgi:hypothetical protein
MITHQHSHVPASGAAPTNVREGNWCTIMVACDSPRNSLLKIKKYHFLGIFWRLIRVYYRFPHHFMTLNVSFETLLDFLCLRAPQKLFLELSLF